MKRITLLLGGTPGTGKTTIARKIKEITGTEVIHLTDYVKEHKLWEEYDDERDSYVIDEENFIQAITRFLDEWSKGHPNAYLLLEGHFVELIPEEFVKKCVILRTDTGELRKRLLAREYNEEKIMENIEAEIMEICLTEALYAFTPERTSVVFTSKKNIEDTVREVLHEFEVLEGNEEEG